MSLMRVVATPALWLCGALLLAGALPAGAACLTDEQVAAMVASYEARQPAATPEGLSDDDAACTRAKFNAQLAPKVGGPVAGYKAGLTNPAVQKRFGANAPVWGVVYAPMLLQDGATVDAAFGARPLFEADMLVRISDAAINDAKTPQEAIRSIDQIIPAIELPDLVVAEPGKLNGAGIGAINVGARYFVLGTPIPVEDQAALLDALPAMRIVVGADGQQLDAGAGRDVLEHPLNAVTWLAQDLRRHGLALKKGDLVSVGSFSKLLPPKPGQKVMAQYEGLPGNPVVTVQFR